MTEIVEIIAGIFILVIVLVALKKKGGDLRDQLKKEKMDNIKKIRKKQNKIKKKIENKSNISENAKQEIREILDDAVNKAEKNKSMKDVADEINQKLEEV